MFTVDVTGFGRRPDDVQKYLRDKLYQIVDNASHAAGLPLMICHHEDRGDGLFAIAPACVSTETLLGPLVDQLRIAIRHHNRMANEIARIQIRAAIHAGYVTFDSHGVSGCALIHLFRLLDCPQLKSALRTTDADFALAVSDYLYNEVVRHNCGSLDPSIYRSVSIGTKEGTATAWFSLTPPPSAPGGYSALGEPLQPPQHTFDLTREEVDIALLVAAGKSHLEIARELNITLRAVKDGLQHVLGELCLTTSNPGDVAAAFVARLQQLAQSPDSPLRPERDDPTR